MEFTLKVVIVMILLLVATFIFASIIMGMNADSMDWFRLTIEPMQRLVTGE